MTKRYPQRMLRILVALGMALSASMVASPMTTAAGINRPLLLPFEPGHTWFICQGYRGGSQDDSHKANYPLDIGWTAQSCTSGNNDTANKTLTAPWHGRVIREPTGSQGGDYICVKIDNGGSVALSHSQLAFGVKVGDRVTPGMKFATVKPKYQLNNNIAHLHLEVWSGDSCYLGSPLAFSGAQRMQCANDLPFKESTPTYPITTKLTRLAHGTATFGTNFLDICANKHGASIAWAAAEGITSGCDIDRYCPSGIVTRGQMATFLVRLLPHLPATSTDYFTDDEGSVHESNINRIRAAGITSGCTATTYCPNGSVTRGQMATFLGRALGLPASSPNNHFTDDNGHSHEARINALADEGITHGCNNNSTTYCPDGLVARDQMAAFLKRSADYLASH